MLDQRDDGTDHICLTAAVSVDGATKQKDIELVYYFNFQPDLEKFTDARSSKTITELEQLNKNQQPLHVTRNGKQIPVFSHEELGYTVPSTLSNGIIVMPLLDEDGHHPQWPNDKSLSYFVFSTDANGDIKVDNGRIKVEVCLWKGNEQKDIYFYGKKEITITACDAPNSKNTCKNP